MVKRAYGSLTLEILRNRLSYDPMTGVFTWLHATARGRPGSVAGARHPGGYLNICINNKLYLSHRLAWFYVTGSWPPNKIDHINCVRDDNRFSNLRLANDAENSYNKKPLRRLKGAYCTGGKYWYSAISAGRRQIYLGSCANEEEAHALYCAAARRYHGEFANPE